MFRAIAAAVSVGNDGVSLQRRRWCAKRGMAGAAARSDAADFYDLDDKSKRGLMLFFDADGSVEKWVAEQLGADSFGPARAIGITLDKKFLGGVVYHRLANENV